MSIFKKEPRTNLYTCSLPPTALPGLSIWERTGPSSYKVSIRNASSPNQSPGESGCGESCSPTPIPITPVSSRSTNSPRAPAYRITLKSYLLAVATEDFLTAQLPPFVEGAALQSHILSFCRQWEAADTAAAASLVATTSSSAYYSQITVNPDCYAVCTKLNELRSSEFGLVNSQKRNHQGVKVRRLRADGAAADAAATTRHGYDSRCLERRVASLALTFALHNSYFAR